jgi:hypothetical protein
MGTHTVDPKVWVLEQLLSEEETSIELIQGESMTLFLLQALSRVWAVQKHSRGGRGNLE